MHLSIDLIPPWFDYRRQKTTDPYFAELSIETGIPVSELIQSLTNAA